MIDKQKEKEFNEWLDSIQFVDEEGNRLPTELTEDESPDPEKDRGEMMTNENQPQEKVNKNQIIQDVIEMKQASINAKYYGPKIILGS